MALEAIDKLAAQRNGGAPEDDEPFALETLTARETCALPEPPDSDELLGPVIRRGCRTVLGGATGEGKTTFATAMIHAITTEREFLGLRGGGGRALILDAEQGLRSVKRKLREAGLEDSDAVDYLRVPDGLAVDTNERHFRELDRVLRAGQYSAVSADPLYKLHGGDSNAEREAVDLMRRFDAWREEHHFALILPVHLRKPPPGAKFSLNEFFGSSAYLRGAEVVIGIQRVSDGYSRLHFLKDRDGDLPVPSAWGLLYDREQGFRRDPKDGASEPTCKDRVRDLLTESDYTAEQLAEVTGNAPRTVKRALTELGAVGSGWPKSYSLPADEVPSEELEWD